MSKLSDVQIGLIKEINSYVNSIKGGFEKEIEKEINRGKSKDNYVNFRFSSGAVMYDRYFSAWHSSRSRGLVKFTGWFLFETEKDPQTGKVLRDEYGQIVYKTKQNGDLIYKKAENGAYLVSVEVFYDKTGSIVNDFGFYYEGSDVVSLEKTGFLISFNSKSREQLRLDTMDEYGVEAEKNGIEIKNSLFGSVSRKSAIANLKREEENRKSRKNK